MIAIRLVLHHQNEKKKKVVPGPTELFSGYQDQSGTYGYSIPFAHTIADISPTLGI